MHGEQRSTCRIRWFDRACGSRFSLGLPIRSYIICRDEENQLNEYLEFLLLLMMMMMMMMMMMILLLLLLLLFVVVVVVVVVVVAVSAVRRMHHSRATTFGSRRFNKALKFRFVSDFFGLFLQLSHARSAFRSDW